MTHPGARRYQGMSDEKASVYSDVLTVAFLLGLLLLICGLPWPGVLLLLALAFVGAGFLSGLEAAMDWVAVRAQGGDGSRAARSPHRAEVMPAAAPIGRESEV